VNWLRNFFKRRNHEVTPPEERSAAEERLNRIDARIFQIRAELLRPQAAHRGMQHATRRNRHTR
jgi:hypothetical protein